MRALNTRLRKIELSRNSKEENQEARFIYIMWEGTNNDEDNEERIIGVKSKDTFHKLEENETVSELQKRIEPLYRGGNNINIMMYVYEDD